MSSGELQAVEDVVAAGVVGGNEGVVEGEFRAWDHAEFAHDVLRGEVVGSGDGDDFAEGGFVAEVREDGAGAFGGEAAMVCVGGETPADFDRGLRAVGDSEAHGLGAEDADEFGGGAVLEGEHGEAVASELQVVAVDGFVGFFAGHEGGEVAHDDGVGVDGGEGRAVAVLPGAEEEARGGELEGGGQGILRLR